MKRKARKSHRQREVEKLLNEVALRSLIIMLLGYFVVLFTTRPAWAVNLVRLLIDAAKGVGTCC